MVWLLLVRFNSSSSINSAGDPTRNTTSPNPPTLTHYPSEALFEPDTAGKHKVQPELWQLSSVRVAKRSVSKKIGCIHSAHLVSDIAVPILR